MLIGVALCDPTLGGTAQAGVLSGLEEIGVKIGSLSGYGYGGMIAAMYAGGIKPKEINDLLYESLKYFKFKHFFNLFYKNDINFKRNSLIIKSLEKLGIKIISDITLPLFILSPSNGKGLKIITSKKNMFIKGSNIKEVCDIRIKSAFEEILSNDNYDEYKFPNYFPLNCIDNNAIFTVVRTTGKISGRKSPQGYILSIKGSDYIKNNFQVGYNAVTENYKEILTNLYLK